MPLIPRRGLAAALLLVLVGLVVAGCGSSNKSSSTSTSANVTATKNDKIAAEVPAAVKNKGTLVVAADTTYAPNEFIAPDGKTVIGMDPDLVKALAAVMGLKAKVVNAT